MNRVFFTAIIFALASCGQPTAKQAEVASPSSWTDPSGRVTLTIPPDWHQVDAASAPAGASGDELVIFAPRADGVLAQCQLTITTQPLETAGTRELLNEATDRLRDEPFMLAHRASAFVDRTELTDVNGIRVLDMRGSPGTISTFERRFFFTANTTLELYTLHCSASAEDQPGRLGANALANSLQLQDL